MKWRARWCCAILDRIDTYTIYLDFFNGRFLVKNKATELDTYQILTNNSSPDFLEMKNDTDALVGIFYNPIVRCP